MKIRLLPLPLMLGLAACAEGPAGSTADLSSHAEAIRNGTREPQRVVLDEGQKLAIGWLHPRGWPGSNFCTGTLIAPRVVVTATHCTEEYTARDLSFGVGLDPAAPRGTFEVVGLHEHPQVDAALLVLDRDATALVPEIRTIAANSTRLDRTLVGQEVEASGYGETYDASRTGRYFAVVEVAEVTSSLVVVDGRGRQGLCFGDSGGPILAMTGAGAPVVLGVEHGGDSSCVGVDQLTRLDPIIEWMREQVGELDAPGGPEVEPPVEDPPAPGCGDVDYAGTCEGQTAVWCEDGALARHDCAQEAQTCGYVNAEIGYYCREPEAPPPPPVEPEPAEPAPEPGPEPAPDEDVLVSAPADPVDPGGARGPVEPAAPSGEDLQPARVRTAQYTGGCQHAPGALPGLAWFAFTLLAVRRRRRRGRE